MHGQVKHVEKKIRLRKTPLFLSQLQLGLTIGTHCLHYIDAFTTVVATIFNVVYRLRSLVVYLYIYIYTCSKFGDMPSVEE